ncbi:MAG: glutamate--tRNA ligase [Candidatus Altiarchaeales archaeon]|nr:glutamate--tRNA ligase [Candidatus Altiarchaeales archaeon]
MTHELNLKGDTSKVVMRFAPNPNGPPTLGHARGIVINSEFVKKYNGKLILRFDDTDPKTKKPMLEAYGWYVEDCKWLGFNPDKIVECSSRLPEYYKYAEELIKLGKAYICECSKERFKECRDSGLACMHRDKKLEENLAGWRKMLSGGIEEGQSVLRIKTDLNAVNPAERDWVAFRIVKEPHPKTGLKYCVWPMLDFAGAIEDHLLEVTHIIRGKDLSDSGKRQQYVYDYLGWKYPEVLHWGRIKVTEEVGEEESEGEEEGEKVTKLSTSKIAYAIKEGEYSGWDDPRLHTLMAFRRRGITPEAIRNLMLSLGLSESDINVSMENLYSENRKILDAKANRYFFVENPVEILLKNPPLKTVRIALHPSFKERGVREQILELDDNGNAKIFIAKKDSELLEKEGKAKLIGLPCVQKTSLQKNTLEIECIEEKTQQAQKMHWVQDYVKAEVLMNDKPPEEAVKGYCEKACLNLKEGEIIQFERFGFCRLDKKEKDKLIFCFGHN